MFFKRPLLLACLFALATGCGVVGQKDYLDGMVGQDVDVAIEALGQPDEVIALGEGRNDYVWRRIFTYDYGPPSFTLEQWRYDGVFAFEDDFHEAVARRCETRMTVGFDFVIESWDYGCETITVYRDSWPTPLDQGNPIGSRRPN